MVNDPDGTMKARLQATLHRHRNDLELLALVSVLLLVITGYLADGIGSARQEGASWRHIDTEAVRSLIDAGDLSDHEALWYHPASPPERHREDRP